MAPDSACDAQQKALQPLAACRYARIRAASTQSGAKAACTQGDFRVRGVTDVRHDAADAHTPRPQEVNPRTVAGRFRLLDQQLIVAAMERHAPAIPKTWRGDAMRGDQGPRVLWQPRAVD